MLVEDAGWARFSCHVNGVRVLAGAAGAAVAKPAMVASASRARVLMRKTDALGDRPR
jgi:hypothetical protein